MTEKQEKYLLALARKRGMTELQLRGLLEYVKVCFLERARVGDGWKPESAPHPSMISPLATFLTDEASQAITILKSDFLFEHDMGRARDRGFIPSSDYARGRASWQS